MHYKPRHWQGAESGQLTQGWGLSQNLGDLRQPCPELLVDQLHRERKSAQEQPGLDELCLQARRGKFDSSSQVWQFCQEARDENELPSYPERFA